MSDRVHSGRHVFVSHASSDAAAGMAVVRSLEARGIRCWIAPRDVREGEPFADEIMTGIRECPVFLVVHTVRSDVSAHVMREVTQAATLRRRLMTVRVGEFSASPGMRYYLDPVQAVVCASLDDEPTRATVVDRVRRLLDADDPPVVPTEGGVVGRGTAGRSRAWWALPAGVAIVAAVAGAIALRGRTVIPAPHPPAVPAAGLPPAAPDSFPDPLTSFPALPPRAAVADYAPRVSPEQVALEYVNEAAGSSLRLVLLDVGRFFSGDPPWRVFPFPADGVARHCNNFDSGQGWFAFSVRDEAGRYHYLGDAKLFDRAWTRIVVKATAGGYAWEVSQWD